MCALASRLFGGEGGGLRKGATVANMLAIVLLQLRNLEKQTEMSLKSKCSSSLQVGESQMASF